MKGFRFSAEACSSPDAGQETLCLQVEKLIVGPFQATNIKTLIVIDALDECRD